MEEIEDDIQDDIEGVIQIMEIKDTEEDQKDIGELELQIEGQHVQEKEEENINMNFKFFGIFKI